MHSLLAVSDLWGHSYSLLVKIETYSFCQTAASLYVLMNLITFGGENKHLDFGSDVNLTLLLGFG